MKTKIMPMILVAALGAVSCDKIAPPTEGRRPAAEVAPAAAVAAKPKAFMQVLLSSPILDVYTPEFSYSLRSQTDGSLENGGKNSIAVEFWGLTVDEAEARVREKLMASGFQVISENSGNGSHSVHYAKAGGPADVLVNVAPIGPRMRTAPDSVGTIYFEWSN